MDEKGRIVVAQIIGKTLNGGVEACIFNYFKAIDKSKVTFDFFVENTSDIINKDVIESMGGRVIITPKYTHLFKYISFLKKTFKKNEYDIVHSNLNTLSVFPLFAAWLAHVKVRIAHSHSTSNKKEHLRNLIKNILRPFSKVFATDYFACSKLAGEYLFGKRAVKKGRVFILHNAVDIDRFKFNPEIRKQMREKYHINDDEIVLGNIGRMVEQKNQTFLLDILKNLDLNKYKLVIVGDGPLKEDLHKKTAKLHLENNVIFVEKTAKPEYFYNLYDIFLLPSLYEGLPVVGVEAQVNGLSIVCSSNITRELKITSKVYFLKNNKAINWVDRIKSCNTNRDFLHSDSFKNYDTSFNCAELVEKYSSLIRF